ncbi:MAG: redoxin domain-containing protein [Anaerolineales bacterium]|nr:redoxin domain-containing protein [Anaerolineales bacterium]
MNSSEKSRVWLRWVGIAIIAVGVIVAAYFVLPKLNSGANASSQGDVVQAEPAPVLNAPAPDFTLTNLEGDEVSLSDFQGQPVLINFWATWCAPCRIEMPAIQDRFERFSTDGLAVLAVDFDEPASDVQAFGDELGLTFDLLLDPGAEIQRLYLVQGYPTSFFVDREGIIRVHHIGVMTEGQLDGYLAEVGLE